MSSVFVFSVLVCAGLKRSSVKDEANSLARMNNNFRSNYDSWSKTLTSSFLIISRGSPFSANAPRGQVGYKNCMTWNQSSFC